MDAVFIPQARLLGAKAWPAPFDTPVGATGVVCSINPTRVILSGALLFILKFMKYMSLVA